MSAAELSAVQLALAAQSARDSQRPDSDASLLDSEPIAIIGMACRFPGGADDPEKLWTLLAAGVDTIAPVPRTRWNASVVTDDATQPGMLVTPHAGLLHDIEGFDADFFGIAPREAVRMDPQQRLLLEVTWDALRDAGCTTDKLRGSATGVFASIYSDDYARNLYGDWDAIDAHTASGNSHGVSAGRISYLLDLRGPALAIDTACSSSLVAVHTACRSLRAGETSAAIVCAASLLIAPEQTASLSKWGMMAPDGRTKAFDAAADGWVRGEGAGALILKRLADAIADGDRVHAVIRGTAINQDGRSAALTAPNGAAQRAVIRAALINARMSPSRVSYVEAHGTGTAVGDPIELEALVAEIGNSPGAPCLVGTVKANLGHLEAAAGVAGVIKVVQSLKHERIPPHLHFSTLNPLVSLDGTRLRIAPDGAAWPATRELRAAGVSSFGFGGTNAHVVLEEAPRMAPEPEISDGPWLLTLSAHDPEALRQMSVDIGAATVAHRMRDVAWTLSTHDALRYRATIVVDIADSAADVAQLLRDAASANIVPTDRERGVAFVFSGHGSQWAGMAHESLLHDATFAASLKASDAIVRACAGWSPIEMLTDDTQAARLDDTAIFQPVLVALQLAMADSWIAAGQKPVAVLGHSVGELSAACIAGALTRQQALEIAVDRGRLMQEMAGDGAMLAVQGDESVIRRVASESHVVIAGENAAGMLTLSGSVSAVEQCRLALEAVGMTCQRVRVSRAFHSPAIHTAASALATRWTTLTAHATTLPLYSSVTGVRIDGAQLDTTYWERNAREPVRFGAASDALIAAHQCAIIEISPHPVLTAPLLATLETRGLRLPAVATWRRNRGERATRLASQGALWSAGVLVDREALFAEPGNRVSLPSYRWQRRHAWAGSPLPLGRMAQGVRVDATLPGHMTEVPALKAVVFDSTLRAEDDVVREHRVCGRTVVPGAMLLLAALNAAERSAHLLTDASDAAIALYDVMLDRALAIDDGGAGTVQITVRAESDGQVTFAINSRISGAAAGAPWDRHASGRVARSDQSAPAMDLASIRTQCSAPVNVPGIYAALERGGVALGPAFQLLTSVCVRDGAALATLIDSESDASLPRTAARLDAALHPLGQLAGADDGEMWLPVSYDAVMITRPNEIAHSHLVLRGDASNTDTRVADVELLNAAGISLGMIRGLRVQRTNAAAVARGVGAPAEHTVFSMQWSAAESSTTAPDMTGERWLVLEDAVDGASPIADAIEHAGGRCVRIAAPGAEVRGNAAALDVHMRAAIGADRSLFDGSLSGVVYAHGLSSSIGDSAPSADIVQTAGGALVLVRELATRGVSPSRGVLFVTRGGAHVQGDVTSGTLAAGALWGLRNTAAAEHPELGIRIVDVPVHSGATIAALVLAECHSSDAEPRVAHRGGERRVARLQSVAEVDNALRQPPFALLPPSEPTIEALAPVALTSQTPDVGMVEIEVVSAGLNFRDVLGVLGMVKLPMRALGGECAGIVTAVGDGVHGVAIGDRVVAFVLGALRTHVNVLADMVAPMPPWMSFEAASALPVAYLTAYYALVQVANVQPGERVLVHAAAGGVGLAAVHVAQWRGATVVGSAGSEEKRAFLQTHGVREVFDSRAVNFREALRGTSAVNVVLNSLSDDFIPASIDALAPRGRLVEIGKRGIWTADEVAARRADVAYSVFDLSDLPAGATAELGNMLRDVMQLVARGALPPLPTTTFPVSECVSAFRFMAQARHIGKIALTVRADAQKLRTDGTYVVTGAFGALGRGVVERLMSDGVRSFALMARRAPDADAAAWLELLRARGAVFRVFGVDVSDRAAVESALAQSRRELSVLRGVVHTAGVNDDGALVTQTAARLAGVTTGKVDGAWHLDQLTRDDALDAFILFSSASGVLGWPGQSTYSSANSALDQIASLRRAAGRTAVSLQWGLWAGGGMADRVDERARRFAASGMTAFTQVEALATMMALRTASQSQLLVVRADWNAFANARPADARLYSAIRRPVAQNAAPATAQPASVVSLVTQLTAMPASLRADAARDAVMRLAARMLGLTSGARVDAERALRDLGLDSLMAVELRNAIGAAVQRTLPATLLFECPTINALAAYVVSLVQQASTAGSATSPVPLRAARSDVASVSASDVDELSDAEAEALLREELAASRLSSSRQSR